MRAIHVDVPLLVALLLAGRSCTSTMESNLHVNCGSMPSLLTVLRCTAGGTRRKIVAFRRTSICQLHWSLWS